MEMQAQDYTKNQAFSQIYEHAIPVKGAFKKYIGTIKYTYCGQVYRTKVMTKTGTVKIGDNTYTMIQGYIQVQPFVYQFIQQNQGSNAKINQIRDWLKSNVKWTKSHRDYLRTETKWTVSIEGSSEVKGTYFHPNAFTHALRWTCSAFDDMITAEFEQAIVQQNIARKTEVVSKRENKQMLNPEVLALHEQHTGVQKVSEEQVQAQLPDQVEEEEKQSLQDILTAQIQQIEITQQQLEIEESTADGTRKMQIFQELWQLSKELNKLNIQLRQCIEEQGSKRPSEIYGLRWKHSGQLFYVGLTVQGHQDRYKQHIKDALAVFQTSDMVHIAMAGRIAEFICANPQYQVSTQTAEQVFTTELLKSGQYNHDELKQQETKYMSMQTRQGITLLNTQKMQRVRSTSSRSARSSQRSLSIKSLQMIRDNSRILTMDEVPEQQEDINQSPVPILNISNAITLIVSSSESQDTITTHFGLSAPNVQTQALQEEEKTGSDTIKLLNQRNIASQEHSPVSLRLQTDIPPIKDIPSTLNHQGIKERNGRFICSHCNKKMLKDHFRNNVCVLYK